MGSDFGRTGNEMRTGEYRKMISAWVWCLNLLSFIIEKKNKTIFKILKIMEPKCNKVLDSTDMNVNLF